MGKEPIEKLFEDLKGDPEDFKVEEFDWGEPVGEEVW